MEEYQDVIIEIDGDVELDVKMRSRDVNRVLKFAYKLAEADMPWWDKE